MGSACARPSSGGDGGVCGCFFGGVSGEISTGEPRLTEFQELLGRSRGFKGVSALPSLLRNLLVGTERLQQQDLAASGAGLGVFPSGIPRTIRCSQQEGPGSPPGAAPPHLPQPPQSARSDSRLLWLKGCCQCPPVGGFSSLLFIQLLPGAVDSPPLLGRLRFQNFLQVSGRWQAGRVTRQSQDLHNSGKIKRQNTFVRFPLWQGRARAGFWSQGVVGWLIPL